MGQETREAHQLNVSEGVAAPSTKKDAASEIVILPKKGLPRKIYAEWERGANGG